MTRLTIFVSGTWRTDKAAPYADVGRRVGELIAANGWSLACGPGTGIARHVIDGIRSVTPRLGDVRYHLPAEMHMVAAGEVVELGAVEIVQTELDYPMRNVFQVSQSAGLIAVTGGDGTLEEILPALIDYRLPVAVLAGSGEAATALALLLDVFPAWKPNVFIGTDPDTLVTFVLERVRRDEPIEEPSA